MKTVLFVPVFQESIDSRDYKSTIQAIHGKGYHVEFVPIDWKRTTILDWAKELDEAYSKHSEKDTVLAGFSYGAMTALLSASKRNPYELWLFSLSRYFAEDIPKLKVSWAKEIEKRRVDTFSKLKFDKLAKLIKCKTLIFAGEKEIKKYPIIGDRSTIAKASIRNSELQIVSGSDHDVTDPRYIATIQKLI